MIGSKSILVFVKKWHTFIVHNLVKYFVKGPTVDQEVYNFVSCTDLRIPKWEWPYILYDIFHQLYRNTIMLSADLGFQFRYNWNNVFLYYMIEEYAMLLRVWHVELWQIVFVCMWYILTSLNTNFWEKNYSCKFVIWFSNCCPPPPCFSG